MGVLSKMGNAIQIGQNTPVNILNLFYALENGTANTGEFIIDNYLTKTETLLFSTGLDEIHGFMVVDADWYEGQLSGERTVLGLYMNNNMSFRVNNAKDAKGYYSCLGGDPFVRASYRIDGGDVYCTAHFEGSAAYTPFEKNHRIIWVAW